MPRSWSTRSSNQIFASRNPKVPSSPRLKAELSSTRNASKETSSFSEPADQHPSLAGTAVSMTNMIFLTSAYERSRHRFHHSDGGIQVSSCRLAARSFWEHRIINLRFVATFGNKPSS